MYIYIKFYMLLKNMFDFNMLNSKYSNIVILWILNLFGWV